MDLETLINLIEGGGTPVIVVIAYLIWKLERAMTVFITDQNARQDARDRAINDLHEDLKAVLRNNAGD